jgi:cytochrome c-type biogenesis protein CcmF
VFVARVLGVMGLIAVGFLAFIMLHVQSVRTAVPMPRRRRRPEPGAAGSGHDVPSAVLYMGYVGFSVAFAFSIAALLGGELEQAGCAGRVRGRTSRGRSSPRHRRRQLVGVLRAGLGRLVVLGSGGERQSFMPWLVGTALIHCAGRHREARRVRAWTILLSIFAFSLSLLGTFLVRSGVLTSVHAFASDPRRGRSSSAS